MHPLICLPMQRGNVLLMPSSRVVGSNMTKFPRSRKMSTLFTLVSIITRRGSWKSTIFFKLGDGCERRDSFYSFSPLFAETWTENRRPCAKSMRNHPADFSSQLNQYGQLRACFTYFRLKAKGDLLYFFKETCKICF